MADSSFASAAHARRPRVTFYVQHLLGIGHLARAFRIADALADTAFDVDLIVGGLLPPGFRTGRASIITLPPVKAGEGGFSALVHPDGTAFDAEAQANRRDLLLAHIDRHPPDVLVVEAFPFGRRQMRFELLPLLERLKARRKPPLVVASIRDILQEQRRSERIAETVALIERFFDLILVHGDPSLVRLDRSFAAASLFAEKIAYTGLVAPRPEPEREEPSGRFSAVVSVGGGAVGGLLLQMALAARPLTSIAGEPWLFLTGPNLDAESRRRLEVESAEGAVVMPFVTDLAQVLRNAAVSISQAGYNTVADILVAGCRSVLVPFAAEGETEQTLRASLLEERGRAVMVSERALEPVGLARAIDGALGQGRQEVAFDLDGAFNTARILADALKNR